MALCAVSSPSIAKSISFSSGSLVAEARGRGERVAHGIDTFAVKASYNWLMAENRLFLGVEHSATGRAWRDRLDERGSARALAIAQRHDLPELLARIIAGRNIEADEVEAFLDPTIKRSMPDPNVLTAMPEAAERIAAAVTRGESVAIFGDYDVDGATSSALLARFLRHCGLDPIVHIPDRLFEGYGDRKSVV